MSTVMFVSAKDTSHVSTSCPRRALQVALNLIGNFIAAPSSVCTITSRLDNLRPGGRLLVPLTFAADPNVNGMGFMLRVTYERQSYAARFLSPVMIFPCIGSRNEESNQRLLDAMKRGTWGAVQSLRRESHEPSDTCW